MKKIILGKKNHKTKQEEVNKERKTRELENRETRKEDITKRSVYAKHYNNEDGTFTMELNSEPIHFFDDDTKQYEDIDNTFEEDDTSLKLTRNSFKLDFSKDLENNQVLRMNKGKSSISLKYFGKKEKNNIHGPRKSRAKARNSDKLTNSIVYEEIAPNVDLEYIVSHNTVKENIVIKEKQESYEFSFELNVGDHKVQLSSDEKNIELVDVNNQVQFIIPAPVMLDEAGNTSDDVSYDLEDLDNGTLILNVKADASWINADERVLPVKIDPQFISVEFDTNTFRHYRISKDKFESISDLAAMDISIRRLHGYALTIELEKILNYNIISGRLNAKLSGSDTAKVNSYEYYDMNIGDASLDGETLKSENSSLIGTYPTSTLPDSVSKIDIKDFLIKAINRGNRTSTIVFTISSSSSGIATVNVLSVIVEYGPPPLTPNHYLNLGQRIMVETISDFDLGITDSEVEEIKIGVLTSVIDTENEKVYQNFQVDNQISVRENTDSTKWNSWKILGLSATFDSGVLYLND